MNTMTGIEDLLSDAGLSADLMSTVNLAESTAKGLGTDLAASRDAAIFQTYYDYVLNASLSDYCDTKKERCREMKDGQRPGYPGCEADFEAWHEEGLGAEEQRCAALNELLSLPAGSATGDMIKLIALTAEHVDPDNHAYMDCVKACVSDLGRLSKSD
ncbi:MAG: hypothetical protein AAF495_10755 [Pseudomonadota bacterium]